jgi:CIC family chloride channel protein
MSLETERSYGSATSLVHSLDRFRDSVVVLLNRYQPPEQFVLMITALIVGLGAGFGAVVFRWLIGAIQTFAFQTGPTLLGFLGRFAIVPIPAIGGLIVGLLVYYLAREAKGHGVPEVMEAMALRGGRIRPIVVVVKSLASSICIGTGGSVGREGPIVQIGSALGSTVGQMLHLSDARIRNLVACGAAGGIAATFNTPIAGVFFALEVIVGEFSVGYFSSVVVASVTASVIGQIFLGNIPAFPTPSYSLVSSWEFVFYAVLGVLASGVAVLFVRTLYRMEDLFERWPLVEPIKPAVGGLLIGVIGLFYPQIFGVGYETIELTLLGNIALSTALVFLFVKIVATSITLGSGGSGGVFAPSLFIGAMLGGAFGMVVNQIWPEITASPGAYALVGMSAAFSGAAHAPITAVIILFEMTGDYRIILPLMLTTVISTVLARHFLNQESIYTLKLSRRGIRLERGHDIDVMQAVQVGEVMTRNVDVVTSNMNLLELSEEFQRTAHHGFPVLDENGDLFGVVTLQDLRNALSRPNAEKLTVADIATRSVLTAFPDEPVWAALKRLGTRDVGRLPVVDRRNPRRLVGSIRRNDIVRAYNIGITRKAEMQHRTDRLRLARLDQAEFVDLELGSDSPAAGKTIAELDIPRQCVVVSVRRGRQVLIPGGDTKLQAGDRLSVYVDKNEKAQLLRCFNGHGASG